MEIILFTSACMYAQVGGVLDFKKKRKYKVHWLKKPGDLPPGVQAAYQPEASGID